MSKSYRGGPRAESADPRNESLSVCRVGVPGAALAAVMCALGCGLSSEAQEPNQAETAQAITAFSSTGDFDGDGTTDQLTTGLTGISIFHPSNGTTRFYGFSGSYAVNSTVDLDGNAGLEVVVVTSGGITVITDRTGTTRFYQLSGSFSIVGVSDTDGSPVGRSSR